MQISASITDFSPLLKKPESAFKALKDSGLDGIEIVMGVKFRFFPEHILHLSKKYGLPIITIHQPVWSGLGLFDEGFIKQALKLGVKNIVFHPLMKDIVLNHPLMVKYFEKLAKMQLKYGITVMLENMPPVHDHEIFNILFPMNRETTVMDKMLETAQKYNFSLTLDTSHLGLTDPQRQDWFKKALPRIKNIHLSSFFVNGQQHLPLTKGDFNTKGFVERLKSNNYEGHLTLEVYYPDLININGFDTQSITDSVQYLKNIL